MTAVGSSPVGNIIVKRDHAARSSEGACACDNHVMAAAVDLGQRVELPGEGIGEHQRSPRIAATAHMVAVEAWVQGVVATFLVR